MMSKHGASDKAHKMMQKVEGTRFEMKLARLEVFLSKTGKTAMTLKISASALGGK